MERSRFLDLFQQARSAKAMLVAFVECEVTYSGRAEAFLPRGNRLILIKQDGCLLVHQPEGGNPINYLKAGGKLSLEKHEGHLVLKGSLGKEYIDLEIFTVREAMLRRLEDGQRQTLEGNERDMSDMLRQQPELLGTDFRPLSREEQTAVGFIDLFGHDGNGNLVVVECKRYTAGLSAISQLHRYVEKVKETRGTPRVVGIMASPKITTNALEMLKSYGYSWREVRPPKRHDRDSRNQISLAEF